MTHQNITIIVNSSDDFEDCWAPFFKLFTQYWPNCHMKILLNTETINWHYPGLNLQCTQVGVGVGKLTWSECLIRALALVDTPLVLYLQEDYFIEEPVNVLMLNELVDIMLSDANIKHIELSRFGSNGLTYPTSNPNLWTVDHKASYRISTQAGLWRTDTLNSYLEPEENGWMFEIFGTIRARRRDDCFLKVIYSTEQKSIFTYVHTGIIKGKWNQAMPNLFAQHGIEVDFEKRGFYKETHWLIRKFSTFKKLLSNPMGLVRSLGLLRK